jgi:hypothetical protein
MPKNAKQAFSLLVIGGLAALGAGISTNVSKQEVGFGNFAAKVIGGSLGAGLGFVALGGKGARLS